ncbi:copper amine oxidase N-terminal domain-containing protein [Anaerotignum sp.]
MKRFIGLAMAVCSLAAAMPVAAAEFPAVDVATECSYQNRQYGSKEDVGADAITMKQMVLSETEAEGFAADAEFVFSAEGKMQFADKEKIIVENESVKAECTVEDGSLVVKILEADGEKLETIVLPQYQLNAENGRLPEGVYGLFVDYHSSDYVVEQAKVVENFVDASHLVTNITSWKITIPVGEDYILSGTEKIEVDAPAYLSKTGYTMLPVRAVANAFGMHPKNVYWDAKDKTVSLLYGEKIIVMKAGEKQLLDSGTILETSAAMEIVDGRAFLPMRDLGNVLGATDITWDAATKTAVLSGSFLERGGR